MNDEEYMEKIIRDNKEKFMASLPEGHHARFATKLQAQINRRNRIRRICLSIPTAIAAIFLMVLMIENFDRIQPQIDFYQVDNKKVVEMRKYYEKQLDEAVIMLENVSNFVDDSTKNEIIRVINNLSDASEVFAEIAPLPEEKQLAITSKMYDNQLETLNILYKKINRNNKEE